MHSSVGAQTSAPLTSHESPAGSSLMTAGTQAAPGCVSRGFTRELVFSSRTTVILTSYSSGKQAREADPQEEKHHLIGKQCTRCFSLLQF